MEQNRSWESGSLPDNQQNLPLLMEHESLLPCSPQPINIPSSDPHDFSPHPFIMFTYDPC
jgi:hypothetical protein